MYLLRGKPVLDPSAPFQHEGVSYPANWIQVADQWQKDAIGLTQNSTKPGDSQFYINNPDGSSVPRPVVEIQEACVKRIKDAAGFLINTRFPAYKQANMLARSVELVQLMAKGIKLTIEQQAEADALQAARDAIKAVRIHSDKLEAEVKAATFAQLEVWQPHDWPAL